MKQSRIPNGVLIILISAILILNGCAAYFEYSVIPNITKFVSVIVLMTLFYSTKNRMANVFLTIFLLTFLGDAFEVFKLGDSSHKISKIFYLGSYLLLIFILLGKLKRIKYEGLVSVYLILILLLNSYFLYMLYGEVKENFSDNINLVLYICHAIILIALSFFAFAVYLSKESTQSILFLIMAFCLVFSDILNYISTLYVYFWFFDFISNMLHVASFYLFYLYVSNHHNIIRIEVKTSHNLFVINDRERLSA